LDAQINTIFRDYNHKIYYLTNN